LLLLADIKESGKFAEAGGCVFVNSLKNYIIESAPKKQYDFYVALFENDVLKMIHTPQHPYETEYQSTVPLHGFYDDNFYYKNSGDRIRDNVKKQQLIALRSKKEATTPKVDAEKIQSAFKKVTDKFKFSYREYPVSAKESIANECKFTLETGNELPEEIRAMLKMFNGNGPFLNWNFISSKTKKIHKAYKNASMNELTVYGKTKAGKLLPVANSPYWIAFYQDNVYTYAVDLLPGANGEVGQVILLQKNKRPQYVAKNIESFLKLYLDEKVLTDLTDWQ
jgi:cell wall assembly regulator SMI1